MPHAETQGTMAPTVNGDSSPSSAFISHLTSYPLISDSIATFKSNPYGQKSISLADSGYQTLAKPVMPYLAKPYQYVSPYLSKADSLADSALSKVDEKLPIVMKPTGELYDEAKDLIFFPYKKTLETKDYVFKTYSSECKKVGGEGIVTMGKAAVTTTLIVSSDALTTLSSYLSAKKEQTKEIVNEKVTF